MSIPNRITLDQLKGLPPGKIASLSAPSGSGRFEWGKNGHVGYTEHAIESSGMAPGIACACNHAALDELLAEQIKIYFRLVKKG